MVDRNESLIREVDEELRREQIAKLWEKYGIYAVIGAALIILGIGGFKYLEWRRNHAAEAAGAQFSAALRSISEKRDAEAQKALEDMSKSGPGGYGALARLQLAAESAKAGKTEEAVAAYDAIAKDGGVDRILAEFAQLQAAMLRLDAADWTELQNRLNDLASGQSAWRFSAREALGLAAFRAGKSDEARRLLEQLLGDRETPASLSERARIVMAALTEAELAKGHSNKDAPEAGAAAIDGDKKP